MSQHGYRGSISGFSLVEVAVVMLIAGVLFVIALRFAMPLYYKALEVENREKMRIVEDALASYALRNYRLPCPADPRAAPAGGEPFGAERFSGVSGDAIPANCGNALSGWTGIAPFRTLGISRETATDAWGRYFTYAISPAFALDVSDPSIRVHPSCRTREWYYLRDGVARVHRNPRKARFCCPGQSGGGTHIYGFGTDIRVRSRINGTLVNALADPDPRRATGQGVPNTCPDCEAYATTDEIFTAEPNILVPPGDLSASAAYVLLSHGRNGFGHFQEDGSVFDPAGGGPDEDENADSETDAARIFIENRDIDESGTNTYDDILVWKTQDLMFAEQGESCVTP